jgi:serine beta-lactamase-like protein LACTB, mitochondrial
MTKLKTHFCYIFPLFIFLALSNLAFGQSAKKQKQNLIDSISKIAQQEITETGTPSLQIAIGLKGEVIYENAFGFADLENNIKATAQTKYRTASVTKWWTATLAMILADSSKLDIDAPIQKYCSNYPAKDWEITTRQLLTHTSGIRHYTDFDALLAKAKTKEDTIEIDKRRYPDLLGLYTRYTDVIKPLNNFKNEPLQFKPGTKWEYSSNAYRVLGCVIDGAAGLPYRQLMQKLIFSKAGMNNTVEDDSWAIVPNRASGYVVNNEKQIRRANMRDVSENIPAGGYLSTASDLVRFAIAFSQSKLVNAETVKTMTESYFAKPRTNTTSSWMDAVPIKEKYGYGIMSLKDGSIEKFGHGGRQDGASAMVYYIPENGLVIAVMTNAKGWNGFITFTKKIETVVLQTIVKVKEAN